MEWGGMGGMNRRRNRLVSWKFCVSKEQHGQPARLVSADHFRFKF